MPTFNLTFTDGTTTQMEAPHLLLALIYLGSDAALQVVACTTEPGEDIEPKETVYQ